MRHEKYPVETSKGPAGSSVPPGWQIIIIDIGKGVLRAYYVRED